MSRFSTLLEQFFYSPEEDVGPWFEPMLATDNPPYPAPPELLTDYLAFGLEGESFALPIHQVREIVRLRTLTEIPGATESLLGIINLRGDILPVYDIRSKLELGGSPPTIAGPEANIALLPKTARLLIVHGHEEDSGVLVDQIIGVARLRPSEIELPRPPNERECVTGLGHWERRAVMLLDAKRVLG